MKILALDAASPLLFCGLVVEEQTYCIANKTTAHHSEILAPGIASLLEEHGRPDLIVCGSGPGSFSGLRIALASTKGLALALNIPFVLAATLQAWATNQEKKVVTLALLDARSQRFYAQFYEQGRALTPVSDLSIEVLKRALEAFEQPYCLCGPAAPLFRVQVQLSKPYELEKAAALPFLRRLAQLGYQRWQKEGGASSMAAPTYLRAAIAQPLKLVESKS